MTALLILVVVQCVIASIVMFVLKGMLERELERAAVEKFSSLKAPENIDQVTVYYASSLSKHIEHEIKTIAQRKSSQTKVIFEQLQALRGGLMIKIADEVLDFSVSSRLEYLWS